ncbi:telomeric repeat binding factor a isoform X2 [Gouania willdenowi]|uniref:Telomeric repeat-binding factor 2-like n=1 Tax=Gouania willdenowi TaxID=441366 RepID=A0A8C5EGM3_GOUWI|nr:telomeric repeat-binding factor 2-like isoform X2 [Gouania willdenowi]
MAANTVVNIDDLEVEALVNRWLSEYFASLAVKRFKENKYDEFDAIRSQLDYVLTLPVDITCILPSMIQVVHFLSRIKGGENHDLAFESADITPLESALMVLEEISHNCHIPVQDLKDVSTSIKEMIIRLFIKNDRFDKAQEMLNKHFPTSVGKESVFRSLIRQKSKAHETIEQLNFQRFAEEMVDFCQKNLPSRDPFLHKAAMQLLQERKIRGQATECSDRNDPVLSCSQVPSVQVATRFSVIQKTRLELAYTALAADMDNRKTFTQLEEEVDLEREETEEPGLQPSPGPERHISVCNELECRLQRDAGSPMEASPADQPQQTHALPETQAGSLSKTPPVLRSRRPYSVARLVMEPDSQPSSQCTIASETLVELFGSEISTEDQPQPQATVDETPLECSEDEIEVTVPTRKRPRSTRKPHTRASAHQGVLSTASEEESPDSMTNREPFNQSTSSIRGNSRQTDSSVDEEEDPQEMVRTPEQPKEPTENPQNQNPSTTDEMHISDSSLDSSPNEDQPSVPQKSSTPHKASDRGKGPSCSKWKVLYNSAKESKETWSDEESYFTSKKSKKLDETTSSVSGHKRRMWTESETQMLKKGVQKFGEGNWSKINSHYSFNDRTNVNLKDRWRTMQKLKLV